MTTGLGPEDYTRALAFFGEQLREVADDQWELPTPCPEWDVRALVAHVVLRDALIPPLLAGETDLGTPEIDVGVLGSNPMAAWRGTALAVIDAVGSLESLDVIVDHPVASVPARVLIGFRVIENLVHGWDLATALGRELDVPDDLADRCLEFWVPLADSFGDHVDFGSVVDAPADARPGLRFLARLGRQVPAS